MSAAACRTYLGHYQSHHQKGERQIMLTIALPIEDGRELLSVLPQRPHRSQNIPIVLGLGHAATALATIFAEVRETAAIEDARSDEVDAARRPDDRAEPSIAEEEPRPAAAPPSPPLPFDFRRAVAAIAEHTMLIRLLVEEAGQSSADDDIHERLHRARNRLAETSKQLNQAMHAALAGAPAGSGR